MATLVLGDRTLVFLDALATALGQHRYAVRVVTSSRADMIAAVGRERPDACLVDRSPDTDEDAARTIGGARAASSGTAVLVLGADPGQVAVNRALTAGASGYVHQSRGLDDVIQALDGIQRGSTVIDVPENDMVRRSSEAEASRRLASRLTSRERECMLLLLEGLDTTGMVKRLGVSRTTVRTHLQSVLTKLGVHSRLEAASLAVRHRLPDIWLEEQQAGPCTVRAINLRRAPVPRREQLALTGSARA